MRKWVVASVMLWVAVVINLHAASAPRYVLEESLDIAEVPAGFPVGFCLLTHGQSQYVAYYDKQRRMTVASRELGSTKWTYQVLPTSVVWDTHNYITMAVDGAGHLHVSGNMHCVPLIYFRAEKAGDVTSLKKSLMTGRQEKRCTYPKFVQDADGRLVFHYRDGGSGRGNEIYNVYDTRTRKWRRLLSQPLTDGQGRMNAYMAGPSRGSDGWFHMHWVWRDTPDCATNHHLSYARSRDLIHWESAFGQKVALPIRLDMKSLWVDPIPSGGGIINGGSSLFLDARHRPVLSYHKSDAHGNMQIYAARPDGKIWSRHLLTDWDKPVQFSGGGSMGFIGIGLSALSRVDNEHLTLTWRHRDYGRGRVVVEEKTLRPVPMKIRIPPEFPSALGKVRSAFPGMAVRRATDSGGSGDGAIRYILQWETLGRNRDRPRKPPLPEPSMLRLLTLRRVK